MTKCYLIQEIKLPLLLWSNTVQSQIYVSSYDIISNLNIGIRI